MGLQHCLKREEMTGREVLERIQYRIGNYSLSRTDNVIILKILRLSLNSQCGTPDVITWYDGIISTAMLKIPAGQE